MTPPHVAAFGPDARPRSVLLTFDNLGEASELERGKWDKHAPPGRHPSVTVALPRLLDELDAVGLAATFFVEAINCELYPQALIEIASRGHELGVHGWRHEPWAQLGLEREREILVRASEAFTQLGLAARAFRPPGGELTANTTALLREFGFQWYSAVGGEPSRRDGVTSLPFDWELVDAYHLMDRFGELRRARDDSVAPLTADALADRLLAGVGAGRRLQTVILHPFLMLDPEWWHGVRRILALISELGRDKQAWTVPGGQLATWLAGAGA